MFEKKYNAKEKEKEIKEFWEKEEIYKFDKDTNKPVFSIDTPPPTMSGRMHIGHAFSYSQQDFIARYKRMNGYEVYYPFGTDDNGLPTEKLVQKEKNVIATQMEREEFIKLCTDYINEERPKFIEDWKRIGVSCDFSLFYSTIDDYSRKISQKSFLDLAKKGLVYRKEAPVLWDTMFQSAIAQAELEDLEVETYFNDIIFKTEDGEEIIISTTRPELLGGCVAIFVHPDDKRYKHLIGKFAYSPLYNEKVPIYADERVSMDIGTGIVMCCTFGDQTDIEWYKEYNLPLRIVITKDGRMNERAGNYKGMKIEEARKAIIEDLKNERLLKSQRKIKHIVNVGERSGRPIEIINSKQWYVRYLDKKEEFLAAAKKLAWHPSHMYHRLENWINGLKWDWSISRQRYFGVPIPVWYCKKCGAIKYADETQLPVDPIKDKPLSKCDECGSDDFEPEKDVFDTWFTSASSPFLAIDLVRDHPVYKKLFPMDLRPQAHDIINFWLFYTLAKTQLLHNTNPWKHVIISGWVLDPHGKKMSKSKGNVVSPQETIERYSADAIRYAASTTKLGYDQPFQEKSLQTAIKIVNKLYNANKFAAMLLKDFKKEDRVFSFEELTAIDKWAVAKLQKVIKEATSAFESFDYAKARAAFELFFMRDIADNYIEIVKQRLWRPEEFGKENNKKAQKTLYYVLYNVLKGLAPIMPYITEEIYRSFYKEFEGEKSIHLCKWPEFRKEFYNEKVIELGDRFVAIVKEVRKFKASKNLSMKAELSRIEISSEWEPIKEFVEDSIMDFKSVTGAKEVIFKEGGEIITERGDKINIIL